MENLNLNNWMTPYQVVFWAKLRLGIHKPNDDMTYADIRLAIRWIGVRSCDTIFLDGNRTSIGRIGTGLMLTVTLLVFPEYYTHYELWQRN